MMSQVINLQDLAVQSYIDSRIKVSKDDLLHVMQVEHRNFENNLNAIDKKIDKVEQDLGDRIDKLEVRIDKVEQNLGARIDKVEIRIDKVELNLNKRIDVVHIELVSMKKWAIGMFIAVLAAIAALAVPVVFSLIL